MIRRLMIIIVLTVALSGLAGGVALAQEPLLDLPPGIANQAGPLMQEMMERMQDMGMSTDQMAMMMADMQAMTEDLPPGLFLELLKLMPGLTMEEMLALHQALHQDGLLQGPPGQIIKMVGKLAR